MEQPTGNGGGKCPDKCSKCASVSAENRRLKRKMDYLKKIIDYQQQVRTSARVDELNRLRIQEIEAHRWLAKNRRRNHSESGGQDMEKVFDSINKKWDDYVERAKKRQSCTKKTKKEKKKEKKTRNCQLVKHGKGKTLMIKRFFRVQM